MIEPSETSEEQHEAQACLICCCLRDTDYEAYVLGIMRQGWHDVTVGTQLCQYLTGLGSLVVTLSSGCSQVVNSLQ